MIVVVVNRKSVFKKIFINIPQGNQYASWGKTFAPFITTNYGIP